MTLSTTSTIGVPRVYNNYYIHKTNNHYKYFFLTLFLILTISSILFTQFVNLTNDVSTTFQKIHLSNIQNLPKVKLRRNIAGPPRNPLCTHWDCFNIFRCGHTGHDRIAVYVYPLENYVDEEDNLVTELMSREYFLLLKAVVNSKYYTANPHEACIFIPSIDTLNEERILLNLTSRALNSLPL